MYDILSEVYIYSHIPYIFAVRERNKFIPVYYADAQICLLYNGTNLFLYTMQIDRYTYLHS